MNKKIFTQRVSSVVRQLIYFADFQPATAKLMTELHWLPVAHHIQYKVALLMFTVHDNRCPLYLSESVQPVSSTFHPLLTLTSLTDLFVLPH